MNLEKIRRVLRLAQEFGSRATRVLDDIDANDGHFFVGTKATGALRRTSVELTRTLADLGEEAGYNGVSCGVSGSVDTTTVKRWSRPSTRQRVAGRHTPSASHCDG